MIGLPARINIFGYRIYYELNPADGLPNYGAAAAISLPFLAVGVVLLVVYNRAMRNADRFTTVTGKAYRQKRLTLGAGAARDAVLCCSILRWRPSLPAAVLIWTSLFGFTVPSLDARRLSIAAYRSLFSDPASGSACATRCWSPRVGRSS